ncbi:hypothetical protein EII22_09500 [Coriobacteriales bacterium OH1046]|nr:hypothetical protein EII22_09500 [Coriobacteriales bacterium OH1046]
MAEGSKPGKRPVKRVFIDADTGKQIKEQTVVTDAKDVATRVEVKNVQAEGEVGSKRTVAIALWVVALVFEALAVMSLMQSSPLYGKLPLFEPLVWMIVFLALDLVCVIIAGQLWKKANRIDPPSEKNAAEFFIKSQLGAILSIIAFLPFVIIALTDKNADKRTKIIAVAVAVVAMLVGGGTSADFNPVSAEDLEAMQQNAIELGDGTVYWTEHGTVYHLNPNCHHITNSNTIYSGDAAAAYERGLSRPCKDCARADGSETIKAMAEAGTVTEGGGDAAEGAASGTEDAASQDDAA